jgi:beta-N-acetylhexosaminidase
VTISACILGCAGASLSGEESALFAAANPWGFILFGRNIETPDQVRALVESFRAATGRPDAPVLVDQEGGRVQRLKGPHWRRYPPARAYGDLGGDAGRELAWLGARLIAADLAALGISVDCLPVLDTPVVGANDIIGDRAYGTTVEVIASLGRAAAEGLLAGGVLPVIKHMPGHGRAKADSHLSLPVVDAPREALETRDFATFKALRDLPMAMTAHVVYTALDRPGPATTSPTVIGDVIRGQIGFEGLLMSDDLSMKALSGGLGERAAAAIAAGCDIALHCNGDMAEMKAVVQRCGPLAGAADAHARAALARRQPPEPFDTADARARFDAAFAGRWAA